MTAIDRFLKKNIIIGLSVLCVGFLFPGCSQNNDKGKGEKKEILSTDFKDPSLVKEDEGPQVSGQKDVPLPGQENETLELMPSDALLDNKVEVREINPVKTDGLISEFNALDSSEKKIERIESLAHLSSAQDPSLINFVRNALDDADPEVGEAAIELLEDYTNPEILPVIAHALEADEADTRAEATKILSNVNDPQVSDLINTALMDDSEDVREAAIEVAEELQGNAMFSVMVNGISSQYNDVKYEIVSILEDRGDHNSVDLIIEGLRDNDPDFREEVNETLEFLIDRKFETYEDAQYWWGENKHLYDKALFKMDEEE